MNKETFFNEYSQLFTDYNVIKDFMSINEETKEPSKVKTFKITKVEKADANTPYIFVAVYPNNEATIGMQLTFLNKFKFNLNLPENDESKRRHWSKWYNSPNRTKYVTTVDGIKIYNIIDFLQEFTIIK